MSLHFLIFGHWLLSYDGKKKKVQLVTTKYAEPQTIRTNPDSSVKQSHPTSWYNTLISLSQTVWMKQITSFNWKKKRKWKSTQYFNLIISVISLYNTDEPHYSTCIIALIYIPVVYCEDKNHTVTKSNQLVAGNIPVKNKNILLIGYITDSVSILFCKYEITHSDFSCVHTNPTMFRHRY